MKKGWIDLASSLSSTGPHIAARPSFLSDNKKYSTRLSNHGYAESFFNAWKTRAELCGRRRPSISFIAVKKDFLRGPATRSNEKVCCVVVIAMSSHQFSISKRNNAAAAVSSSKAACFSLVLLVLGWPSRTECCRRPFANHHRLLTPPAAWGTRPTERIQYNACLVQQLRGGGAAAVDSDEDEDDEVYASDDDEQEAYDSDDEQEEEYDDEEDEEEEEKETTAASKSVSSSSSSVKPKDTNYVDPWFPSPMMGIYSTIGLMMLSKRTDLFSPTVVKVAR